MDPRLLRAIRLCNQQRYSPDEGPQVLLAQRATFSHVRDVSVHAGTDAVPVSAGASTGG